MNSRQRAILAVALVTQGVSVGLVYAVPPVFLEALESTFHATRTQIAVGPVLIMAGLTVGGLLTGVALDRGYARGVLLAGASVLIAALLVASRATSLATLACVAVAMGFSTPSIGPLAGASLVTRFFDEGRGRALGLIGMGPPLGSGLFAAVAGWSLLALGLRESFVFFAGVAFVAVVPLVCWAVPARFESRAEVAGQGGAAAVSMREVLARPLFWWSAIVFALAAGIATGWTTHAAAYLGGVGLSPAQQSGVLAAQFWLGVPGALVFGALADRFPLRGLFVALLAAEAGLYAGFALGPSPLAAGVMAGAFGFLSGGLIPLYLLMLGRRMGPDALGRAMGLSNVVMLPVMSGAVLLAAAVYERTGGYAAGLGVFSVGMLIAIGCMIASERSERTS